MQYDDLFVSLDMGSSKVSVTLCGELAGDDRLYLLARSEVPTDGLRKGVVIDIERTARAVNQAMKEVEAATDVKIESATVSVAGGHIRSMNTTGVVAVPGAGVTSNDVRRCIESAKSQAIPADREVIHSLPQSYTVDSHEGVREPVGMAGRRLEARVHVVTASVNAIQNVIRSVKKAGFEVEDVVLEPLASAYSVLDADEKDLGVCVVDLGSGTTDLAIYSQGELKHTQVIGVGGDQLTRDLSSELLTPVKEAERIKQEVGDALPHRVEEGDLVEVPSVGGRASRRLERRHIAELIEVRLSVLFERVRRAIQDSGYAAALGGGVVLTGGGANLHGVTGLAERVLDLPVRRGVPRRLENRTELLIGPETAVGVGLCQYARHHLHDAGVVLRRHRHVDGETTGFFKITKRLRELISGSA